MGNYRFKLSDMIPNSWFHKLKDMGKTTTGRNSGSHIRQSVKKSKSPSSSSSSAIKKPPESQPPVKPGRASYYIPSGGGGGEDKFSDFPVNVRPSDTKILTDPQRKSKKKPRGGGGRSGTGTSTCKAINSSVSSVWICHTPEHISAWMAEYPSPLPSPPPPSLIPHDDDDSTESLRFYDDKPVISCKNRTFTPADIIIDIDNNSNHENPQIDFILPPPIRTKMKQPNPNQKPDQRSPRRRTSAGIQRLRTRANSPRISTKKTTATTMAIVRGGGRKGLSGSFAVVKSSVDPHKDFRESMVEMIAANNIRTAKDLEELLTCYLSLNSDEYHDVIVKVFEQIWFELTSGRKL